MATLWSIHYDDSSNEPFHAMIAAVRQEAVRHAADVIKSKNPEQQITVDVCRYNDGGGPGLFVKVNGPVPQIYSILEELFESYGIVGFVVDADDDNESESLLRALLNSPVLARTVKIVNQEE